MTEGTRNNVLRGAAGQFAHKARELAGVAEIAICGSVAGNDPDPYDLDIAVVMTALDSLEPLAKYARQMSSISHAWEVFLFDHRLIFQGRICQRRECPGGSVECMGPNCGKIPHVRIAPGFQFDEIQFFESPFEILHQTTEKSYLLGYKERIGIGFSRTYTPLKPMRVDCIECGRRFTIDAGEQKWYTKGGLTLPKRCDRCRSKKYF
jgi:predicted nucleotidyltransferase